MKIDKELLSEKNYTGTRLIWIKNPMVAKLKKEIETIQKQANPFLKKMDKMTKVLDPFYTKMREHQDAIKKIQEEMKPTKDLYDIELKEVEALDSKATLIKNKITPIIHKELEGQLEEFEEARQTITKGDVIYVEVINKIEDFIKGYRTAKLKK